MQLDRLAVAAMKGFVSVQNGLYGVLARRNVPEAPDGIALCCGVYKHRLRSGPAIDRDAKNQLRARRVINLKARLGTGVCREKKKQASIERLGAEGVPVADGETLGRKNAGGGAQHQ